jgi:hypothetical protein
MAVSTLFVLPLDPKYICTAHQGILEDPVTDAQGRSMCRACKLKNGATLSDFTPNSALQEDIDSLLCYCKYGVTKNENGELIPIPNNGGCAHIVKYASRLQHEATCEFRNKDTSPVASPPLSPPLAPLSPPLSSIPSDASVSDLRKFLEERDARIAILEQEILTRDREIYSLRMMLQEGGQENPAAAFAKRTANSTKELWDELLKVIVEDIPSGLSAARTSLVQSEGYQKSSEALTTFKDKVAAKAQSVGHQASELHPLDKLISALVDLRDELVQNVKHVIKPNNNSTTTKGEAPLVIDSNNNTTSSSSTLSASTEDPELHASLQRSLASFEEEERAREGLLRAERAALAAATVQSLRDATMPPTTPAEQ